MLAEQNEKSVCHSGERIKMGRTALAHAEKAEERRLNGNICGRMGVWE